MGGRAGQASEGMLRAPTSLLAVIRRAGEQEKPLMGVADEGAGEGGVTSPLVQS